MGRHLVESPRRHAPRGERHAAHGDPVICPQVSRHSDASQASQQRRIVSPRRVPRRETRGGRLTQFHGRFFHPDRDFRVPIRRLQADVSEPTADHIHLDAGFEERDGRSVPTHMGCNPARGRPRCRSRFKTGRPSRGNCAKNVAPSARGVSTRPSTPFLHGNCDQSRLGGHADPLECHSWEAARRPCDFRR